MPERTYTFLPTGYAVCGQADCSLPTACLHQLVYPTLLDCQTYLRLINPNQCSKDEKCKFYQDSKPVMYAPVDTNLPKKMISMQY